MNADLPKTYARYEKDNHSWRKLDFLKSTDMLELWLQLAGVHKCWYQLSFSSLKLKPLFKVDTVAEALTEAWISVWLNTAKDHKGPQMSITG